MGEKYYKPILKNGDHLVKSKNNPSRVRGQSRDENNKNPDIIEWEEYEVEERPPERTREEMEYELERLAYEERRAEQDKALSTLDTINSGLELVNGVLVFLNENPEVAAAIITGGRKVKNAIKDGVTGAISGIKSFFGGSKKTKAEEILEQKSSTQQASSEVMVSESSFIVDDQVIIDEDEREEMSIDEARSLIISILANYVSMKKNIDRLSKARINDVNMPQLDMNQVLAYMDSIVEKYPALMDEKTSVSVLDILHGNSNAMENRRIIEALRIEQ